MTVHMTTCLCGDGSHEEAFYLVYVASIYTYPIEKFKTNIPDRSFGCPDVVGCHTRGTFYSYASSLQKSGISALSALSCTVQFDLMQ